MREGRRNISEESRDSHRDDLPVFPQEEAQPQNFSISAFCFLFFLFYFVFYHQRERRTYFCREIWGEGVCFVNNALVLLWARVEREKRIQLGALMLLIQRSWELVLSVVFRSFLSLCMVLWLSLPSVCIVRLSGFFLSVNFVPQKTFHHQPLDEDWYPHHSHVTYRHKHTHTIPCGFTYEICLFAAAKCPLHWARPWTEVVGQYLLGQRWRCTWRVFAWRWWYRPR